MTRTLVLGVGNLLMGDEGVGCETIRQLEEDRSSLRADVELLDGGTGGFHLLGYIDSYDRIIMIDATIDGKPPGSVSVIHPRFSTDFPRTLSAHDIGLRDLIETHYLLGHKANVSLVTVSVEKIGDPSMDLTPAVRAAVPQVVAEVHRMLV